MFSIGCLETHGTGKFTAIYAGHTFALKGPYVEPVYSYTYCLRYCSSVVQYHFDLGPIPIKSVTCMWISSFSSHFVAFLLPE